MVACKTGNFQSANPRTRQSQWLGQVRHALSHSAVSGQEVSGSAGTRRRGLARSLPTRSNSFTWCSCSCSCSCFDTLNSPPPLLASFRLPCSHLGIASFFLPLQSQPTCDHTTLPASIQYSLLSSARASPLSWNRTGRQTPSPCCVYHTGSFPSSAASCGWAPCWACFYTVRIHTHLTFKTCMFVSANTPSHKRGHRHQL